MLALVDGAVGSSPSLDFLVNNAGMAGRTAECHELDFTDLIKLTR